MGDEKDETLKTAYSNVVDAEVREKMARKELYERRKELNYRIAKLQEIQQRQFQREITADPMPRPHHYPRNAPEVLEERFFDPRSCNRPSRIDFNRVTSIRQSQPPGFYPRREWLGMKR